MVGWSILVWLEFTVRRAAFVPSIADDVQAWVAVRYRVGNESTVILGTSRAQAALDPRAWADELKVALPLQLAIPGGSALPILADLAKLESFRGTVVADFIPRVEFDSTRRPEKLTEPYLRAYEEARRSPARYLEARLTSSLPGVAFRSVRLSPNRVFGSMRAVVEGRFPPGRVLPQPAYFAIRRDRYMSLDFSKVDVSERMRVLIDQISEAGRPAEGAEVNSVIARVERSVARIEERGGRVVLVHFPHCGEIEELEERNYPRDQYWDRLEGLGVDALHAADHPALSRFACHDGSHLDTRDSAAFTRSLARIVAGMAG